jgi:hypothetical protein
MQNEPPPETGEERMEEYQGLQKMPAEAAKRLRTATRIKMAWQLSAILILIIFLYQKKSKTAWFPVADSQQMCVVVSDWWGFKVQAYYPVWRKPTGETREYSEQWCIQYPDNSWHVFYGGHGELPAYTYPPITYSTYF